MVSPVIYMRRTALATPRSPASGSAPATRWCATSAPRTATNVSSPSPDRLDIRRAPNPHIAFGAGTHVCLGQHIARVEIDACSREVLDPLHDIELAAEPEWLASNFISGIRRMPIRFRPGPRLGG
jgi:hypothetical protein